MKKRRIIRIIYIRRLLYFVGLVLKINGNWVWSEYGKRRFKSIKILILRLSDPLGLILSLSWTEALWAPISWSRSQKSISFSYLVIHLFVYLFILIFCFCFFRHCRNAKQSYLRCLQKGVTESLWSQWIIFRAIFLISLFF